MDAVVCPNCRISVVPIRVFEQSPKSKQWWRITKCPRERCAFNIDLEECDKPGAGHPVDKKKPEPTDDRRSFWKYGL